MGLWGRWRPEALCTFTDLRAARWTGVSLRRVLRSIRVSVCVAAVGILFLLGVCVIYLPEQLRLEPAVSKEEIPVTLLIWTHPFDVFRRLPNCWKQFQIRGCALTDDTNAYPKADAVLLHHREIATDAVDLPPEPRPSAQKWIWMNYESPTHTPGLRRFEGVFNLTMSYRTDSDIFLPYGYLIPRVRTDSTPFAHSLSRPSHSRLPRDRFVAWVITNWSASHARVAFYYQLSRYIRIDVFGGAGRPLPKGDGHVVRLLGRYTFYLALENSQHTDYITEKLWNAVMAGAIPVVLGPSRQNYERFLPREAFIHVDDFPSVKELARYLLTMRHNPVWMSRHLDWRRGYSLHQPSFWDEHFCTACRVVKRTRGKTNEVKDLWRWFNS